VNVEQGWIEWNGGECSVEPDALVNFRTTFSDQCGWREHCEIERWRASDLDWSASNGKHSIIAYRIVKQEPGK
jgi:hypothetical protein